MLTAPEGSTMTMDELQQACQIILHLVRSQMLGNHQLILHGAFPYPGTAGVAVREHVHTVYEAQIMLMGTAECATAGQWLPVTRGQITLHAPKMPHAWRAIGEPFRRLTFMFSMLPGISVPPPACWPQQPQQLTELERLLAEIRLRQPGWTDRVELHTALLLSRFVTLAEWPTVELPDLAETSPLMHMLDRYLKDNLHLPLSRETIADCLGTSERTLTRLVRATTGTTLLACLEQLRLTRACSLLEETTSAIHTISDLVGFNSTAYFCRRFHRAFGETPGEYRARRCQ